ncbi:MAG: BamA/TamA family outer membrane protein [Candidatus Aminicenantes bacterium]|nr:MAG: BamA/TamA family outer membrane protein [Candidatus Aminicenantes bacterium]
MKAQKGVNKNTFNWLLFLSFFTLCLMSPVFGWMDERGEDDKSGIKEKNQLIVLPFVYYTPETKIAGGLGGIYYLRSLKDQSKGHPSTFFMDIVYTQNKQFIIGITPGLYLNKGKFHLIGDLRFKKYTENFYGIGPQTLDEMEEDFRYRSFALKCSLRKRLRPSLYVGIQYDFEHSKITKIEEGGILDTDDVLGVEGGIISGIGIILVQDSRNNLFYPTKGTLLQIDAMLFSLAIASDFQFQRFTFDFRQYITVFTKHVLALQQSANITSGDVPFQRLPVLGGPWVMRGYIQGRFRDKSAIFFQMEYRVPLIWRLSAAGFVGCGDVADKLNGFKLNDFKISGGLGIRYLINRKSGTNVRLDFGFARGNFGVYAMINEAF